MTERPDESAYGTWGSALDYPPVTGNEWAGKTGTLAEEQSWAQPHSGSGPAIDSVAAEMKRCGHKECEAVGTVRFGDAVFCGTDCLMPALRAALDTERLQARLGVAVHGEQPGHRVPIGSILLEQGTISEQQLHRALCSQRETGAGRLGSWLKQQAGLSEADLAGALAIQWRCPVFRVGTFQPAQMSSCLPLQLMEDCCAIPLRVTGTPRRLTLCFEDHVDTTLVQAAARMYGIAVDAGLLTATGYWQATRELLEIGPARAQTAEADSIKDVLGTVLQFVTDTAAHSVRVVAVHNHFWIRTIAAGTGTKPVYRDLLCTLRTALQ